MAATNGDVKAAQTPMPALVRVMVVRGRDRAPATTQA